jgi:predicted DNA-binding ribbon-helix-helix protein
MKSTIVKRSVVIDGHKTSVSLETPFWDGLRGIAESRQLPLASLLRNIDKSRDHANLSSAIRVFVLTHFRAMARGEPPHQGSGRVPSTFVTDDTALPC